MKNLKNVLGKMLVLVAFAFCFLVGCNEAKIELSQIDGIYEVTPGSTLVISADCKNVNKQDLIYECEGPAIIDNNGTLKVNEDYSIVGQTIKVFASVEKVKSNVLTINIVDLMPTAIDLKVSNTNILPDGGYSDFMVEYTPSFASVRNYTLEIVSGNDIATISEGRITTNAEAQPGDTIEVKATLNSDNTISDTITLTVINRLDLATLITADNINYVVNQGNKYMQIKAYKDYEEIENVSLENFEFISSDENILQIANDGKLIAKGHGEVTVSIKRLNSEKVDATCKVFVMIPPSAIELEQVSTQIKETNVLTYSKNDDLKLHIATFNKNYEDNCTKAVTYKFDLLDENNAVVESENSVATFDSETGITFNKTGRVRITIKSNSSLNGADTSAYEKELKLVVNVNEGINIDSISELVAYADQQTNETANILTDLYLTETENFGITGDSSYNSLWLVGDRVINGNGYVISTERLPLLMVDGMNNAGNDFLHFEYADANTPYKVQIHDLEIVGCGGINGVYTGKLSQYNGEVVVNTTSGEYIRTYDRAINIYGYEYKLGYAEGNTYAYIKDLQITNVKVSGFETGMRIGHAVDGYMSDITIDNCFTNGLELYQNIMTLNNITLGKLGAFGIELTPDDMKDINSNSPTGTAGVNYNETSSLNLTGTINSSNYTNGADTLYFQALSQGLGMTIPGMIDTINTTIINGIVDSQSSLTEEQEKALKEKLTTVLNSCMRNEENKVNFYLLIFVNKTDGMIYDEGNTTNRFAKYESDVEGGNTINLTTLLTTLATDPEYDGYKQYQYLIMDLTTGGPLGNIGQVVLVNEAYDPNYANSNN